jgi:ketosteroid isomerase-like protein
MLWGRGQKCKALAGRFVAALNAHDTDALSALVTEDFTYIDSWREGVSGRDLVLHAIKPLFDSDPEFGVEVEKVSYRAPHVLMSGKVNSARFGSGRRAVWRVRCEGDQVAEWQSWAEGGPPPMTRALAPKEARDLSDRAGDLPDISDL